MLTKTNIRTLLSKMTNNYHSNMKLIKKAFGDIDYTDDTDQSILHIIVDNKYDEEKCLIAVKTLLNAGLNPNLKDEFDYIFIQTALYAGYSEEFILAITKEALKYNLNINHVDSDKDTIMHTLIYSDDYLGEVERIYDLLCENGFNSALKDHKSRNLVQAMIFQKQHNNGYNNKQIESFKQKFEERCPEEKVNNETEKIKFSDSEVSVKKEVTSYKKIPTLSDKDILELEKYGKILNKKNYRVRPTIGREKELKNLMITLAQDKKRPLIVGESGVGKTAIVDELAYRVNKGEVPSFLQGKIILEVNPSDIVAGCRYVGMFEENMTKLMKLCEKFDVIVFIDEIHTIYGVGSADKKNNDMASMLKYYIDRTNLKVIGTTTEKEYNEFFSSDALKRRFEKIIVKEPIEEDLYKIIDKVINDYCINNKMTFENENIREEIINIILNSTDKKHREYSDSVNNPDLSISIIDKAFAFAKVYDSKYITIEHFIESFEFCDRIYESKREEAIANLKSIDKSTSKPIQRILKVNFNKFKK